MKQKDISSDGFKRVMNTLSGSNLKVWGTVEVNGQKNSHVSVGANKRCWRPQGYDEWTRVILWHVSFPFSSVEPLSIQQCDCCVWEWDDGYRLYPVTESQVDNGRPQLRYVFESRQLYWPVRDLHFQPKQII